MEGSKRNNKHKKYIGNDEYINKILNENFETPAQSRYQSKQASSKSGIKNELNEQGIGIGIHGRQSRRCSVMGTTNYQYSISHTKPNENIKEIQEKKTLQGTVNEKEYEFKEVDYTKMDKRYYETNQSDLLELITALQTSHIEMGSRLQMLTKNFFEFHSKDFPILDPKVLAKLIKVKMSAVKFKLILALCALSLFCKREKENSNNEDELKEGLMYFENARSLEDSDLANKVDGDMEALIANFSIISYIEKRFFVVAD